MSYTKPSPHGGTMRAGVMRLSVVASLLLGPAALAQPAGLPAFELERLELNPNGRGSLLMGTGELLPKGGFRLSLAGQYENDPLVMYRNGNRLGSVVGNRVTGHLLAAWAPMQWLELGLQLPLVVWQSGDDLGAQNIAAPASTGLSTPTAHVRLGLLAQRREAPVDLALELGVGLPVGSVDTLSRDSIVRLSPKVMLGRSFGALRAGVEAGALIRPAVVLGDVGEVQDELGNEVRLGAVVATTGEGLRGELNVRGSVPLTRESGSLEVLAGLRLPLGESLEAYALGGPGFGNAPGTPTFRLLLGVAVGGGERVEASRRDDDGDGVMNGEDTCPMEAGPAERQGCPVKDTDQDGLEDSADTCPTEAGTAERQGCPVKDTDKDGLEDTTDTCPTEAGLAGRQGCPVRDADQDGLEDAADKCPSEAGTAERQGCPVRDADKDGIEDAADKCPSEAGLTELRGCPAKDTDGDTVSDHLDNCPAEKGVATNAGCPVAQKQMVAIQKGKLEIKEQVFFATGKAVIQPRSFKMLDQVARILQQHPEVDKMVIEGHTDNRGNAEANRKLSLARAEAVMGYLVSKGVEPARLEAKGFGPDQPIATNKTDKGRAANRRVEFIIVTPERELK
ncbi:outer membrane protein OmpA-like peptidoglycan-associated protein [Archangium gephyra]|uniref:OmpA domain protein n=1 Tax=Archangium gephyra TaxID=48 RepID=A0AAC8TBP9_9BACT|nr:OmpA family protein [Archangium gephyra]AKI99981.1 OmpA domain protein [Archangium gephyra]REG33310.1 outer membrane protein OmpA-like peptidoglycan-associated protein [Archangium gephyra]